MRKSKVCRPSLLSFALVAALFFPSVALAVCGDSSPDAGEQCDDGNTAAGDGCSATCQIESGSACSPAVAGEPPTPSFCAVGGLDLAVMITDDPDPVTAGAGGSGNLKHTITVTNNGPNTATALSVNVALSAITGVSYDSATVPAGDSWVPGSGVWSGFSLDDGVSRSLEVFYTVAAGASESVDDGTRVTSEATVSTPETDVVGTNDDALERTDVQLPPPTAQLTIIKDTNPANRANLDFDFSYTGPESNTFSLNGCDPNSSCGGTEDRVELTLPPGDYTISETGSPGNWDLTAITCEPDGGQTEPEPTIQVSTEVPQVVEPPEVDLTLAGNDMVTCTFKNERRPQIRVFKYNDENANGTEDEGEPPEEGWEMTLYTVPGEEQVQGPRSTGGTGIANFNSLDPGASYYVCEEQREGWVNTDPDLELGAVIDGLYCQLVENLVYGENREVVFGNVQTATIEVTVDAPGPPAEFCFTTTDLEPESFCLTDGETQTFEGLLPGMTYVVTEDSPPFGWVVEEVTCSEGEPQCVVGSISVTPEAGATVTIGTFTFRLALPDLPGLPSLPGTQGPLPVPALPLYWLFATVGLAGLVGARQHRRRRR